MGTPLREDTRVLCAIPRSVLMCVIVSVHCSFLAHHCTVPVFNTCSAGYSARAVESDSMCPNAYVQTLNVVYKRPTLHAFSLLCTHRSFFCFLVLPPRMKINGFVHSGVRISHAALLAHANGFVCSRACVCVFHAACLLPLQDLLAIQMWTSLVLFLGMAETGAQYFGYR